MAGIGKYKSFLAYCKKNNVRTFKEDNNTGQIEITFDTGRRYRGRSNVRGSSTLDKSVVEHYSNLNKRANNFGNYKLNK